MLYEEEPHPASLDNRRRHPTRLHAVATARRPTCRNRSALSDRRLASSTPFHSNLSREIAKCKSARQDLSLNPVEAEAVVVRQRAIEGAVPVADQAHAAIWRKCLGL